MIEVEKNPQFEVKDIFFFYEKKVYQYKYYWNPGQYAMVNVNDEKKTIIVDLKCRINFEIYQDEESGIREVTRTKLKSLVKNMKIVLKENDLSFFYKKTIAKGIYLFFDNENQRNLVYNKNLNKLFLLD